MVEVCTSIVESRGLENQGIYRIPGNTGAVSTLQELFNKAQVGKCKQLIRMVTVRVQLKPYTHTHMQ